MASWNHVRKTSTPSDKKCYAQGGKIVRCRAFSDVAKMDHSHEMEKMVRDVAQPAKIVFIDDDTAARTELIEKGTEAGFRCRGFQSAEEFLDALEWMDKFHFVVTEYNLPGILADRLLERLRKGGNTVPVIIVAKHIEATDAVRCIKLGAVDYLPKSVAPAKLFGTIQTYLAKSQSDSTSGHTAARAKSLSTLTERQRQIVLFVADGLTSKEIANRLGVSFRTVETHRSNIMKLLNVRSTAELVRLAVEFRSLLTLDEQD